MVTYTTLQTFPPQTKTHLNLNHPKFLLMFLSSWVTSANCSILSAPEVAKLSSSNRFWGFLTIRIVSSDNLTWQKLISKDRGDRAGGGGGGREAGDVRYDLVFRWIYLCLHLVSCAPGQVLVHGSWSREPFANRSAWSDGSQCPADSSNSRLGRRQRQWQVRVSHHPNAIDLSVRPSVCLSQIYCWWFSTDRICPRGLLFSHGCGSGWGEVSEIP